MKLGSLEKAVLSPPTGHKKPFSHLPRVLWPRVLRLVHTKPFSHLPRVYRHLFRVISSATAFHNLIRDLRVRPQNAVKQRRARPVFASSRRLSRKRLGSISRFRPFSHASSRRLSRKRLGSIEKAVLSPPTGPLAGTQEAVLSPPTGPLATGPLAGAQEAVLSPPTGPLAGRHLFRVISSATAFHNLIRDQKSPEGALPGTPPECQRCFRNPYNKSVKQRQARPVFRFRPFSNASSRRLSRKRLGSIEKAVLSPPTGPLAGTQEAVLSPPTGPLATGPLAGAQEAGLSPPTGPLAGRHLFRVISSATAFYNLIRDQKSPERGPLRTPPECLTLLSEPVK